jgi:hypothetical protein
MIKQPTVNKEAREIGRRPVPKRRGKRLAAAQHTGEVIDGSRIKLHN